ncbi:MAG TPA: adenylate/guanylate cyclase domain-containing protein [Stellaceae bacterium]|nr:adenylate/guanylate cyclase domain-containing protein [Stellaceae bacterium]
MRNNVQLRWIAEAEARAIRRFAQVQRAPSEPDVGIAAEVPVNWLRRLVPPAARRILARARSASCSASGETDFDRILVTILITDIVASTRRVAQMGDRPWQALLDRHDNAARAQIRRFGGAELRNNGDGFLVMFDGPTRAIRCAAAIAATTAPLGLAVRSGVHAGEIHLKRREISGLAVHVTARIAAIARPAEVLVSKTVRDLVAGSGLLFDDRGIQMLRGVPEHVQLYAMRTAADAGRAEIVNLKDHAVA